MEKLYNDPSKSSEFKNLMKEFLSLESSNKGSKKLISKVKKLSTNFSLKEISDFVFKEAIQLTKSDYCYVAYVDPKNKDSVGISFSHLTDKCNMYAKLGEARFKVLSDGSYGGILGYSLDTGISFYVHDISSHPAAHGLPPGHEPVNQFLSVPVKYEGKILGQIVVANPKDDYNEDHLKILDKLADFYAIFLNALLY
ncbi:MAG: GAF domain-containing protein [Methanobacterium sp.]